MTRSSLLFFLILLSALTHAGTEPHLFEGLWSNTKDSFSGDKAYYHLAGAALTPLIIRSGTDAAVHNAFENDTSDYFVPGAIIGGSIPALVGLPLYVRGKVHDDKISIGASYAVFQSTIIIVSYVGILKALTGRPQPMNDNSTSIREQSEEFNFGFLERGVYWGWPSGHMATTTAIVTTLTHYYPEKTWLKWVGYGTAAYMLVSVSAHNEGQMHWFSDGVAGAFMGYAIGSTVGSNFYKKYRSPSEQKTSYEIHPLLGPGYSGIQVVWTY